MARPASGGTFKVHIEGVAKTSAEFKEARKRLRRDIRGEVIRTGTRVILPAAKQGAPSIAKHALVVKASGSSGYIGVKGARKFDRILGLWNFGGTVRTPIRPRYKQALALGGGIVRASVTTPRHYKGSRHLQAAVGQRAPRYFEELTREIMQFFDPIEHTP